VPFLALLQASHAAQRSRQAYTRLGAGEGGRRGLGSDLDDDEEEEESRQGPAAGGSRGPQPLASLLTRTRLAAQAPVPTAAYGRVAPSTAAQSVVGYAESIDAGGSEYMPAFNSRRGTTQAEVMTPGYAGRPSPVPFRGMSTAAPTPAPYSSAQPPSGPRGAVLAGAPGMPGQGGRSSILERALQRSAAAASPPAVGQQPSRPSTSGSDDSL
jgi:hypothetical protein